MFRIVPARLGRDDVVIFWKSLKRAACLPVAETGVVGGLSGDDCAKREAGAVAAVEKLSEAWVEKPGTSGESRPPAERELLWDSALLVSVKRVESSSACARCVRFRQA